MQNIEPNKTLLNANKLVIEKRAYHEDSTPEEIALLMERVFMYEEKIIFYNEIPIVCPFSINLFFQKAEDLSGNFDGCGLIIDVSNTVHPDASTRKVINHRFTMICDKVSHVAFITGKNFLLNTTIRFVLFGTDLKSYSVNKNVDEAVVNIKKNLK